MTRLAKQCIRNKLKTKTLAIFQEVCRNGIRLMYPGGLRQRASMNGQQTNENTKYHDI